MEFLHGHRLDLDTKASWAKKVGRKSTLYGGAVDWDWLCSEKEVHFFGWEVW